MAMEVYARVKLISFRGTVDRSADCPSSEDYWRLIGSTGTVLQDPDEEGVYASFSTEKRVLVEFDSNIIDLGLHCHNKFKNSLWILESDLERL